MWGLAEPSQAVPAGLHGHPLMLLVPACDGTSLQPYERTWIWMSPSKSTPKSRPGELLLQLLNSAQVSAMFASVVGAHGPHFEQY